MGLAKPCPERPSWLSERAPEARRVEGGRGVGGEEPRRQARLEGLGSPRIERPELASSRVGAAPPSVERGEDHRRRAQGVLGLAREAPRGGGQRRRGDQEDGRAVGRHKSAPSAVMLLGQGPGACLDLAERARIVQGEYPTVPGARGLASIASVAPKADVNGDDGANFGVGFHGLHYTRSRIVEPSHGRSRLCARGWRSAPSRKRGWRLSMGPHRPERSAWDADQRFAHRAERAGA